MDEERDCRKCVSKGCMGKEWYSYADIRWCRFQCIWLITHIVELGEGNWPDNPDGSSYVDPALRSKSFRSEAYFCKPVGLVAEVMSRLGKTGEDGITLMEDIQSGIKEYNNLKTIAKRALDYISGFRRRKEPYSAWKYRQKSVLRVNKRDNLTTPY